LLRGELDLVLRQSLPNFVEGDPAGRAHRVVFVFGLDLWLFFCLNTLYSLAFRFGISTVDLLLLLPKLLFFTTKTSLIPQRWFQWTDIQG